jgi:hypothetical protein
VRVCTYIIFDAAGTRGEGWEGPVSDPGKEGQCTRKYTKIFSGDEPEKTLAHLFAVKASDLIYHGAEPFLRSCQLCSHSRNSQHFMEPEGSLPCSQEPSVRTAQKTTLSSQSIGGVLGICCPFTDVVPRVITQQRVYVLQHIHSLSLFISMLKIMAACTSETSESLATSNLNPSDDGNLCVLSEIRAPNSCRTSQSTQTQEQTRHSAGVSQVMSCDICAG